MGGSTILVLGADHTQLWAWMNQRFARFLFSTGVLQRRRWEGRTDYCWMLGLWLPLRNPRSVAAVEAFGFSEAALLAPVSRYFDFSAPIERYFAVRFQDYPPGLPMERA